MDELTGNEIEISRCGNCGAALSGRFCCDCGQEDRVVRRPFWRMLRQLSHAMLDLDGRVYRTLYCLYTRPGFLSTEYLNGRRARYTPPLRMFLVLSISFFLVVSIIGSFRDFSANEAGSPTVANPPGQLPERQVADTSGDEDRDNGFSGLDIDPQAIRAALEGLEIPFLPATAGERLKNFLVDQSVSNFVEAREEPLEFFRDFFSESLEYVTVFILLMMPMLALVLWTLLLFKGRYYMEHFILGLHNHSFLIVSFYLLALTGMLAGRFPALAGFLGWADFAIVSWIVIYLYLSLKNFYRSGYIYSGVVYLLATAVYGTLLAAGLTVFLTIAFLLY